MGGAEVIRRYRRSSPMPPAPRPGAPRGRPSSTRVQMQRRAAARRKALLVDRPGHPHGRDAGLDQPRAVADEANLEVGEDGVRSSLPVRADQHVLGLDVLVQHAHRVGRAQRLGDLAHRRRPGEAEGALGEQGLAAGRHRTAAGPRSAWPGPRPRAVWPLGPRPRPGLRSGRPRPGGCRPGRGAPLPPRPTARAGRGGRRGRRGPRRAAARRASGSGRSYRSRVRRGRAGGRGRPGRGGEGARPRGRCRSSPPAWCSTPGR